VVQVIITSGSTEDGAISKGREDVSEQIREQKCFQTRTEVRQRQSRDPYTVGLWVFGSAGLDYTHTRARTHTHTRNSCIHTYTNTHTHPFNGPFSGTARVNLYQKGKTNLDFIEARNSEWQWHQLGRTQVCISLQTDNHTSTPPLSVLRAGCPSCRPTKRIKTLKALHSYIHTQKIKLS